MLVQRTPDDCQKLQILGGRPAAGDLLSSTRYGKGQDDLPMPYSGPQRGPSPGSASGSIPSGKFINLIGVSAQLEMPGPWGWSQRPVCYGTPPVPKNSGTGGALRSSAARRITLLQGRQSRLNPHSNTARPPTMAQYPENHHRRPRCNQRINQ